MARIGNEARLLLKLAEEQTEAKKAQLLKGSAPDVYKNGYVDSRNDYISTLQKIVRELEDR